MTISVDYFCQVRKTGEIYRAYRTQLISTIVYEKDVSPSQAEAVLEASSIHDPILLRDEIAWRETQ